MQLLELVPGELGVAAPGIYVVDNEERRLLAGPFTRTADAVAWINTNTPSAPPPDRITNFRR